MSRPFSKAVRLLGALALVVLLQPRLTTMLASSAGREFSRCVQNCNEARKACDDRCKTDCAELFPGGENQAARDACIAACKNACALESDDCKQVCLTIKNGCPEEP